MDRIKKILLFILKSIMIFVIVVLVYLLSAFIGARWIVEEKEDHLPKEITVYLLSNGVHTDLVLPVKTPYIDWSDHFSFNDTRSKDTDYHWIGIGWGDKGFYLNTPTWAELKFSVAFKAAFGLSGSAIHTSYYKTMATSESCKKVQISALQYQKLINYITTATNNTDHTAKPQQIVTDAVYGDNDAFYEASGNYRFYFTCNTWTNNALKAAGMRACKWTLFDKGILRLYP